MELRENEILQVNRNKNIFINRKILEDKKAIILL